MSGLAVCRAAYSLLSPLRQTVFRRLMSRRRNKIYTTDLPKRHLGDNAAYTPSFGIIGLKRLPTRPDEAGGSADLPRSVFGAAVTAKHFETAQRLTLRKDNSDVPRRSLFAELPVLCGRAARCGGRIRVRLLIQTSERNCSLPSKRLAQEAGYYYCCCSR